jgi:hypothetical protein
VVVNIPKVQVAAEQTIPLNQVVEYYSDFVKCDASVVGSFTDQAASTATTPAALFRLDTNPTERDAVSGAFAPVLKLKNSLDIPPLVQIFLQAKYEPLTAAI